MVCQTFPQISLDARTKLPSLIRMFLSHWYRSIPTYIDGLTKKNGYTDHSRYWSRLHLTTCMYALQSWQVGPLPLLSSAYPVLAMFERSHFSSLWQNANVKVFTDSRKMSMTALKSRPKLGKVFSAQSYQCMRKLHKVWAWLGNNFPRKLAVLPLWHSSDLDIRSLDYINESETGMKV